MLEDSEDPKAELALILRVPAPNIGAAMSLFIAPGIVGTIASDLKLVNRSEAQC
ncbi:hypothetical protein QUA82_28225 [Microcoleus sp. F8-D3]